MPRVSITKIRGSPVTNKPYCIDLYQGDNVIDLPGKPLGGFAATKAAQISFVIHKSSESTGEVDSRYSARREAWMDGEPIPVTDIDGSILQLQPRWAAYHFLHATSIAEAQNEADHFLNTAKLQPGDDAFGDWEEVPPSMYEPQAGAVMAFCEVVDKACPWLPKGCAVYSGNVAKEQIQGPQIAWANRRLWLCQYDPTYSVQESWKSIGPWLWQNSESSSIAGISNPCDSSTVAGSMTVKRLYAEWGGGLPMAA